MGSFQERVQDEHDELDVRLEKLHVFIEDSPVFEGLTKTEKRLLIDQRAAMTVYRNVLRERIANFRR